MSNSPKDPNAEILELADEFSGEAKHFMVAVQEVAAGEVPETTVPLLLLALTRLLSAGARLGATNDVVPPNKYEPDSGEDPDLAPIVECLKDRLSGIDEYVHVVDPLFTPEVAGGRISDDIAEILSGLTHGLRHYENSEAVEALWWWQFSYVSSWGDRGMAGARALQSIVSHLRLDADTDVVAEATFDALHT